MTTKPIYKELSTLVTAYYNCIQTGNNEWRVRHEERIKKIMRDTAPHGSGIDAGCEFDLDHSTGNKLMMVTSYHHMGESGMYDSWTEHLIIVTPSLAHNFDLRITGSNRNDIKSYLSDTFADWLNEEIEIN